jgi:hypothetical protein
MGSRETSPRSIVKASSQIIDFFATDPLSTQFGLNVSFISFRRFYQGRATLFYEWDKFKNGKRYSAEEYDGNERQSHCRCCAAKTTRIILGGLPFDVTRNLHRLRFGMSLARDGDLLAVARWRYRSKTRRSPIMGARYEQPPAPRASTILWVSDLQNAVAFPRERIPHR